MRIRMLHDVLVGELHYQGDQVYDDASAVPISDALAKHFVAQEWAVEEASAPVEILDEVPGRMPLGRRGKPPVTEEAHDANERL